jgi:hypothetical protein
MSGKKMLQTMQTGHKFDFLNLSVRAIVVMAEAKKKGYVCNQDIRRLYSLHKRSKRSESFLLNLVDGGHLQRVGYDRYVLTEKAERAIASVGPRIRPLFDMTSYRPKDDAPVRWRDNAYAES